MDIGSVLLFVFMIGIITSSLYFMNPKTFKDRLGSVIVYLGGIFAYFGFIWFGVITPGIERGISQATPSELAEIESFVNGAITNMIIVSISIVIVSLFLCWYLESKNPTNRCE